MINTVIYSYWTNNGANFNAGFKTFEDFLEVGKQAVNQSVLLFDKVIIYTDKEGFDKINSFFAQVEYKVIDYGDFDTRFWVYPQMYIYSIIDFPFLKLDFDVILYEKPSVEALSCDLITSKLRDADSISYEIRKQAEPIISMTDRVLAAGLFGANRLDIFKDTLPRIRKYMQLPFSNIVYDHQLIAEEYNLSQYAIEHKYSFGFIHKWSFIHFQGEAKQNRLWKNLNHIKIFNPECRKLLSDMYSKKYEVSTDNHLLTIPRDSSIGLLATGYKGLIAWRKSLNERL